MSDLQIISCVGISFICIKDCGRKGSGGRLGRREGGGRGHYDVVC